MPSVKRATSSRAGSTSIRRASLSGCGNAARECEHSAVSPAHHPPNTSAGCSSLAPRSKSSPCGGDVWLRAGYAVRADRCICTPVRSIRERCASCVPRSTEVSAAMAVARDISESRRSSPLSGRQERRCGRLQRTRSRPRGILWWLRPRRSHRPPARRSSLSPPPR